MRRRTPPFGREHEKPWELEVQLWLRGLHPPSLGAGASMWVGHDTEGLAAVLVYEAEAGNYSDIFLKAAAIARRHRQVGGGVADEMFTVFYDDVTSRAVTNGVPETLITGHIHKLNAASQFAARRNGLRQTGSVGDYQLWQGVLEYPVQLLQLGFPEMQ